MFFNWDAISALATVAATCTALYASYQAWSETRLTLKMQEKSKNVSLLDKRIELATSIQSNNFVLDFVSGMTVEALFDDKTFAQYEMWKKYSEKRKQIEYELQEFDRKTRKPDGEGGFYVVKEAMEDYEIEKRAGFSRDILDKFKEISERIEIEKERENKEKELLLQLMREFTKESIAPLDTKRKDKKRKKQ